MEPSGAIWAHLGPYGAIWDHMGPSGTIWAHLGPYETIWAHLRPYGPYGTIWGHMASRAWGFPGGDCVAWPRSKWEKIETARNEVPLGGMSILGATVKRRLIVISFNGAVDHTHRLDRHVQARSLSVLGQALDQDALST